MAKSKKNESGYDADLDVCHHVGGVLNGSYVDKEGDVRTTTFRVCLRQYNGGEFKVAFEAKGAEKNGVTQWRGVGTSTRIPTRFFEAEGLTMIASCMARKAELTAAPKAAVG